MPEQILVAVDGVDFDGHYALSLVDCGGMLLFRILGKVMRVFPQDFMQAAEDHAGRMQPPHLVFDLSRCEHLSSIALGELVRLLSHLKGRGGHILVLRPSPRVHGLLDVLGLDRFMHVVTDDSAARAWLTALKS